MITQRCCKCGRPLYVDEEIEFKPVCFYCLTAWTRKELRLLVKIRRKARAINNIIKRKR